MATIGGFNGAIFGNGYLSSDLVKLLHDFNYYKSGEMKKLIKPISAIYTPEVTKIYPDSSPISEYVRTNSEGKVIFEDMFFSVQGAVGTYSLL